jgi:medium-chain acyl-[acyl-carrier-protein] hydrolase
MTNSADSWFRFNPATGPVDLRLFCFPHAGGGAIAYREWADHLPATMHVVSVELPGRGARLRDMPLVSLPTLIDELADAIRPLLDIPFAFFGHSMGALIAFELARRLRHRRYPDPHLLIASGRRAPQLPDTEPATYNLPRDEFIAELHRINGTPKEVLEHAELMELMLPLLRADFQLIQTYQYLADDPLDCPITAFGGSQDFDVTRDLLLPWEEQTRSCFALRMLPGGHFFLRSSQALLLGLLAKELQKIVVGSHLIM